MSDKLLHIFQRVLTHQICLIILLLIRFHTLLNSIILLLLVMVTYTRIIALEILLHWCILITLLPGLIQIEFHEIVMIDLNHLTLVSVLVVSRLLLLFQAWRWTIREVIAAFLARLLYGVLFDCRAPRNIESLCFQFTFSLEVFG